MVFVARIFKLMGFFSFLHWMLPILHEIRFVFSQSILFLWRMSIEKYKRTGKYVPVYFVRFTVLPLGSLIIEFQSPSDSTYWFFWHIFFFKPVCMLCYVLSFHKGFQLKFVLHFYQQLFSVNLWESSSVFTVLHSRISVLECSIVFCQCELKVKFWCLADVVFADYCVLHRGSWQTNFRTAVVEKSLVYRFTVFLVVCLKIVALNISIVCDLS